MILTDYYRSLPDPYLLFFCIGKGLYSLPRLIHGILTDYYLHYAFLIPGCFLQRIVYPPRASTIDLAWQTVAHFLEHCIDALHPYAYTHIMTDAGIGIIFQDHHMLLVNKPAGMVIHPTYKHANGTMWDELLAYLAQQGGDDWQPVELPDEAGWEHAPPQVRAMLRQRQIAYQWKKEGLLPRPCLLHRIDKDSSGIVALARTERARRHIIQQFHEHSIVKRYLAVVGRGAPAWAEPRTTLTAKRKADNADAGDGEAIDASTLFDAVDGIEYILDGPLQRDPDDRRRCIVGAEGQEATTIVKVLARENGYTLLEARPITGRTHQIRGHLAALGYGIIGDPVYREHMDGEEVTLTRQFLHAHSLTLRTYPENVTRTFTAPLANDLVLWLDHYFPKAAQLLTHE